MRIAYSNGTCVALAAMSAMGASHRHEAVKVTLRPADSCMEMEKQTALKAAEEQLQYWKQQREIATRDAKPERLAQCEKFVTQCELVVSALRGSMG